MNWLLNLLRRPFIKHQWVQLENDRRRCSVCGRLEEYDAIGSVAGPVWDPIREGDQGAHVAP